ncbi:MAG: ABC transporter ATP-binding protein [Oscillospiraceae bacterium]
MEDILKVNNISKSYQDFQLDHVSFSLPKGAIMGLVGRNGAGKSTTLKCILNLVNRSSGDIQIFGKDNISAEQEIKERIGVVFEETNFHEVLNAKQISSFMKDIYKNWDEDLFFSYLKKLQLPKEKALKEFSRGMRMKISLAAAMSHHADLLILDEPTGGLDPIVRSEILDLFLDFIQDENKGILLSSHITTDLEKIADYITFIDNGKVVLTESKDEILYSYGVLKGSLSDLSRVNSADIIGLHKNQFGFEALVKPMDEMKRKYPDMLVDSASIEEMMLLVAGSKE